MTLDQWIEQSAQIDLDGLEFYWPFTPPDNPSEWERIRKKVGKQGRAIPMMCFSPDFTKPAWADRKREIEEQKRAIRGIAGLGGQFCRVLSGQKRPGLERGAGLEWVRECITELIPFAEQHGIVLVIENHYKDGFWQYPEFAQQMDLFLELLAAIPESPWFGVNYDPSNAIIAGDDPIALLQAVKHRVRTMHASDRYFAGGTIEDLRQHEKNPQTGYASILKHGIIGHGLNDYDQIFSILKGVGFAGWVSIEDGPDPVTGFQDLLESALFLRAKMKQHELK